MHLVCNRLMKMANLIFWMIATSVIMQKNINLIIKIIMISFYNKIIAKANLIKLQ